MVANEMMFIVEENQTIEALKLQDFNILFQMVRPGCIDNAFTMNCIIDIFYYFYLEEVPNVHDDAALIFVARKHYLDWVMKTEELAQLKVKTVNKIDKSLMVSVQIVNAIIDIFLKVIKQYSSEDVQFINRFIGYKAKIFSAPFLQDTNYPSRLATLEVEICHKVVKNLEENRNAVINEVKNFLDEILDIEKELFSNIDVPFKMKAQL